MVSQFLRRGGLTGQFRRKLRVVSP